MKMIRSAALIAAALLAGCGGSVGTQSVLQARSAERSNRVEAVGKITEYALPSSRSSAPEPLAIAISISSAVVAAASRDFPGARGTVLRAPGPTPVGKITEYPIPHGSAPFLITLGPD